MPVFDDVEHCGATDVGLKRSHNQDAYTVQKAADRDHWQQVGHLFIVADGMGGHAVGEKASAKAVQEIPLTYVKHVHDGPATALRRAFQEANAGINAIGTSTPEFRGMGTTATALALRVEGAWIAHVGDSRAYRIRAGQVQQLTYDHSYAWEMARRLGIPPEELGDVKRNVIVRSLGPDPLVQVDVEGPYPLEDGDTFVLCTDGLSNQVNPEEIGAVLTVLPLEEAVRLLIELANLRGGPDNITVVVARVGSPRDSVAVPKSRWLAKASRLLGGAMQAWTSMVPWPITVLLGGLVLAVLFVYAAVNELKSGAVFFFATALLSIVIGLVGLFIHARRREPESPSIGEIATKASIYRQYPIRIDTGLVERWCTTAMQLKEQLEARDPGIDWADFRTQFEAGTKALREGDALSAFRHVCRAIARVAGPYNRSRPRDEAFRPKWERTDR